MINILIPAMGKNSFFKDYYFPKPLVEINGKTMLELLVNDYGCLEEKKLTFVFLDDECKKFHLDDSAKILCDCNCIKLKNETEGALCTSLMAIDYIDNDNPLIIANMDQIIDVDYNEVLKFFKEKNCDAGVITFQDIHPRWSYIKTDGEFVCEVAEKRPLSHDAIAGFYYYSKGSIFVEAAKRVLLKRNSLEGRYYISSSLNEIILDGLKVGYYRINKEQYKSFYSPAKISEYEGSK